MNNSSGSISMFFSYNSNGRLEQNEIENLVEVIRKEVVTNKESSFLSACINTYNVIPDGRKPRNIKVSEKYVFESKDIIKLEDVCRWVNLIAISIAEPAEPERTKKAITNFYMPLSRSIDPLSETFKKLLKIDACLGPVDQEDDKQENPQNKKEELQVKREKITDKEEGEASEKDETAIKNNAADDDNEEEKAEEENEALDEDDDLDGEDEEDPEVEEEEEEEEEDEDSQENPKESVKPNVNAVVNNGVKPQPQPQQKPQPNAQAKPQPQQKPQPNAQAKPQPQPQQKPQPNAQAKPQPQPQQKPQQNAEAKPQPQPQQKTQQNAEAKPQPNPQSDPQKKEVAKDEAKLTSDNQPVVANETSKEDAESLSKDIIKKAEEEKERILKEAEEEKEKLLKEAREEKEKLLKEGKEEKEKILKNAEEEKGTIIADAEAEKEKIIEEAKVEAKKKVKEAELDAEDKIKNAEGRRDNIIGEAVRSAARLKEDAANEVKRLKEDAQKDVNGLIAEGKGEKENIIAKAKLEEKAIIEKAEVEGNVYVGQRKKQLDDFKKLVADAKSTVSKKALKTRSESKIDIFNTRSEIERIKKELTASQDLFKKLADSLNKIDGNIQSAIVDTTGKINKVADRIEFKEAEKATDLMLQIYDQVFSMHSAYQYYFTNEETIHKDDVLDRLSVIEEVIEECLEEYGLSAFSTEEGTPIDPARHEVDSSLGGGQGSRNSIVKCTVKKGFRWDDGKVKTKEKILVKPETKETEDNQ